MKKEDIQKYLIINTAFITSLYLGFILENEIFKIIAGLMLACYVMGALFIFFKKEQKQKYCTIVKQKGIGYLYADIVFDVIVASLLAYANYPLLATIYFVTSLFLYYEVKTFKEKIE